MSGKTHWILQDYRINGLGEQISVPFWALPSG